MNGTLPPIDVVAEYHERPAEGMNVISKTVIDDLRAAGASVRIIPPRHLLRRLPGLFLRPARLLVFTHGPGPRTVLASVLLRAMTRTRLIWLATRPDLGACPGVLKGRRSAHVIIANRHRDDLAEVARDARFVAQPIGIPPERITAAEPGAPLWPELRRGGVPIAVHVGHLRPSRGLERLSEIKRRVGDRMEVIVIASPYFEPDPGVLRSLEAAGVHVRRTLVPDIAQVYRAADLYLFPADPAAQGAIDLPLSVVEAIACGTPVLSTPFGALPVAMKDVEGVRFAAPDAFAETAVAWLDAGITPCPAHLPEPLNAHRIAERILDIARAL